MKRLLTSLFLSVVLLAFLPGHANAAGDVDLSLANFPDNNFRSAVAAAFDKDSNGVLSQTEIAAARRLDCDRAGISDLTGIKYLTALTDLSCNYNSLLTKLDISGMTALDTVFCYDSGITTLNASGCTALKYLECSRNKITSVNFTGCTALETLTLSNNSLTSLDVSSCVKLKKLMLDYNNLTSLDVSKCPLLERLWCDRNSLTSLDVSRNTKLKNLGCTNMNLPSLDVTNCPELEWFHCSSNAFTSLDVSKCPKLQKLMCGSCKLTTLDVTNCPELVELECDYNQISSLDLSKCPKMDWLNCTNNQLSVLDVTSCPELTVLACNDNPLTRLELGQHPKLKTIYCFNNQLTSLNVSGCPALTRINTTNNQIPQLDISANTNLVFLESESTYMPNAQLGEQKGGAEILVRVTAEQEESFYLNPATMESRGNKGVVLEVVASPTQTLAITTQPKDAALATGATGNFTVEASGMGLSYQWQWRASSSGTWKDCSSATSGYNTATLKPEATAARNGYQYRCVITDSNGKSVTSNAATLKVLAITTQPASATVTEGSTASFTVAATNAASYQWQWRASASGTWANCSNATSGYNTATLKPVATAARNGYQYRCTVKDANGNSVTSDAATLTVKAGLAITTQPASVSVAEGSTATFKVVATGASSYQWQWRDSSTGTWKDCSSATSGYNTATLKPVATAARNGYQYRCVVTDAAGKSITSNAATLTVLAISTQPASTTVTEGGTASFTVAATNAVSYQWQWRASSTGTWANCSSATTGYNAATLKPVATAARNGYQYRCIITDANGNTVTSNPVTLTVKAGLAITTQPASTTVTEGGTASFSVVATGASSYQWQWKTSSGTTWTDCSSATTGYNTATLKPVATAARNGYQYRCVVKDSSGKSVTSNAATLTVKAALAITTQPASTTVTEGSTASFKVVATAAASYQWQWRASASGTWANCSSATSGYNAATLKPVATAARNGSQYRCVVKDADGKSVTSNAATLTVKAALAITTQPASTTINEGSTASFKVVATGAASYQWQWRASASGTWANCSFATSGYNAATLKPVATAARNGYQYRCVVKDASGNTVTSNVATLTVKVPLAITTQPASVTVNEGSAATFQVVATGASTYQWQWRASSSGTWANCSSATSGYNAATLKPVGTSARNGYQYRCVIKDSSGNSVTSNAATMTVRSVLAITTQPANTTVAEGSTATFKVTATGASTYQWQWRASSTGTWANCSSSTAGYNTATLKPVGTAARNGYQYRCIVKDSTGKSVTSNVATLTVTSAKLTILTQPTDWYVPMGVYARFQVVAKGDGLTFQWQYKSATGTSWTNSTDATAKTDVLEVKAEASRHGMLFRCVIKDTYGNTVTSDAATMTVVVNITSQPQNATVKAGETAKFTVGATGIGLSYQWQYMDSNGLWMNATFTGANAATLSVPAEESRNGMQVRCLIRDTNDFAFLSEPAVLIVASDKLQVVSNPIDYMTGEGGQAIFAVGATGKGLTYQWQYRPLGSSTWLTLTASGSTTDRLAFYTQAKDNGTEYRCLVRDSSGNTAASKAATLNLYTGTVSIQEATALIHVIPSWTVTIHVKASGNNLSYQWQYRTPNSDLWVNALAEGYNTPELSVEVSNYPSLTEFRCIIRSGSDPYSFLISSPCKMIIE